MSRRIQKVAALLKREISVSVNENIPKEIGIVSITDVDLTQDLKDAKVYISFLDKSKENEIFQILDQKKAEFQKALGKKLTMKFTPKIHFLIDNYQEKIDKVEKLLEEIKNGS